MKETEYYYFSFSDESKKMVGNKMRLKLNEMNPDFTLLGESIETAVFLQINQTNKYSVRTRRYFSNGYFKVLYTDKCELLKFNFPNEYVSMSFLHKRDGKVQDVEVETHFDHLILPPRIRSLGSL